ncbi:MAG: multidrug ABC transporter ATP-binding protein [Candidatus Roseilinea sp.]|nr:MAG: multidrug ABC transporter ATP-binding protein [Candidatus Roseilinea sp.]
MSILTATNLSQSHGFTDVFTGISVSVAADAKIEVIGPNGVGKTTLLRVLAGIDKPSAGSVHLAKDKRVGYLPQEAMDAFAGDANTLYAEMLGAFDYLHAIEARMRELEEAMADGGAEAIHEYGELQERFAHGGGYEIETRIAQTLDGLGFNRSNWDTPVAHLSGGQKTRALLARLLLEHPDLLILDEPTNHLDVDALEWLEKTLIAWDGALLISSHDRYFLDRVVDRIWEMSRSRIEVYRGNYTAYTQQRDARFERSVFIFNQAKARLENELRIVKRDLDAVKAGNDKVVTWVKGKLRRMTKEIVAIEALGAEALVNERWSDIAEHITVPFPFTYEEAERHVRALRPPSRPERLRMTLVVTRRSGEIVLRTKRLVVGYPGNALFEAGDVTLHWRDRIALIGPNGAGKTTFICTALGVIAPLQGEIELGPSVTVGYFAQAHEALDANARVIEEIVKHKRMSDGEARHYLAQFLFTNDDAFKPVAGLSGGERARLALAILQLKGANLLVLDEPTNHLDIAAQEELQTALEGFEGTILLVSHDRYLIDKLATQIWHIESGKLYVYRDGYAEWMRQRAARAIPTAEGRDEAVLVTKRAAPAETQTSRLAVSDKRSKNAERKRRQQVAELEAHIAVLETKLRALGEAIQSVQGHEEARSLGIEYALAQRELDEALKRWETVAV